VSRCTYAKAFQKLYTSRVQDKTYHFLPNLPLGKDGQNFTDCTMLSVCFYNLQSREQGRKGPFVRTGQGICLFCIVVCPMCTLMKDRVHEPQPYCFTHRNTNSLSRGRGVDTSGGWTMACTINHRSKPSLEGFASYLDHLKAMPISYIAPKRNAFCLEDPTSLSGSALSLSCRGYELISSLSGAQTKGLAIRLRLSGSRK
jgi:hypothetical protein